MKTNLTLNHPVNENLYRLIQSLEKSEKRHVKMWLKSTYKKEEQRYTFLFDYLDRQRKYSEEALIKKLRGLYGISRHQVATTKYLLYHIVLRSLRHLYANQQPGFKVREGLDMVEILFEKGLYSQCFRMVERVRQQVILEELFYYLPLLIEWENKVVPFLHPFYHETEVAQLQERTQTMADQFDLVWQIEKEYAQYERIKYEDVTQVPESERQQYGRTIQELSEKVEKRTSTMIRPRLRVSQMVNRYGQWWHTDPQEEEIVQGLTYLPGPKKLPMAQLGEVQRALLELLPSITDQATLENSLRYLEHLPVTPHQAAAHQLSLALLRWHQSMCNPSLGAAALRQQFETDILPNSLSCLEGPMACEWKLRCALDLWMMGYAQRALKLLNQLSQLHKHPLAVYQSDRMRLISLLLLYELEDFSVGEYLLRSMERSLQNRAYDTSVFQNLLKIIKRLFLTYSGKDKEEFVDQLTQVVADESALTPHKIYWSTGIFRIWALSKQRSTSMLDIFRSHGLASTPPEKRIPPMSQFTI